MKQIILTTLLLLLVCGCQQTTKSTAMSAPVAVSTMDFIDITDFGPAPAIIAAEQLFALSPKEQQAFLDYYNDGSQRKVLGHRRLYNYISSYLSNFNYYSQTHTAQQAIDLNSGNCLSLAILTTAYANLANIKISYNEMTSAPIFSKDGQFEFESGHVVSKLLDPTFKPQSGILYITKPQIVVDYFPTKDNWMGAKVKPDQFIAMYYRNLSADELAQNNYRHAAWLAVKSLQYAPNDLAGINLIAVIHRRLGMAAKAETLYKHGLTLAKQTGRGNLMLLSNYHLLLTRQGRINEANAIKQTLDKTDDPSPFHWLKLADEALAENKLNRAQRYYQKVIEKAHYLPYGYEGLAKVYYLKGRVREAKKYFNMALQRTHDDNTEKRYEAKLAALGLGRH